MGFVSDEQLQNDCNTVACAIEWAAMLPSWIEVGFYIDQLEVEAKHLSSPLSQPHNMSMIRWKGNPKIDSYEGIQDRLKSFTSYD